MRPVRTGEKRLMTTFESLDSLRGMTREAVVDLLYRMADDELIIGHRHSEWGGDRPIPAGFESFVPMAWDEISHARAYYEILHQLAEPDFDTLRTSRSIRQYRCASLVSLPNDNDWTFCILRQFLYDAAEMVRLTAITDSTLSPLADLATELRRTESEHLIQGRRWVLDMSRSGEEHRERLQAALQRIYPHALGMFEPTEADVPLVQAGICPHEDELLRQWESAVAPVLGGARLDVPDTAQPVYGGRVGQHHQTLGDLLEQLAESP